MKLSVSANIYGVPQEIIESLASPEDYFRKGIRYMEIISCGKVRSLVGINLRPMVIQDMQLTVDAMRNQ
jgi:hypothetical protein